ncbi:unnamed protein product [Cylicocyclus nassatus]|uniref:CHK kinase-like domain-containing protein n=1 Tax=Cylicocyclus nassatus TaxID=53992 RepID=A0AA36DN47_CYLNA|nr:unnamed protein product [Cylicocyclus nassatus]
MLLSAYKLLNKQELRARNLMALYKPADGILRTNLTWEDLQDGLFEAFGKQAKLGPNKTVEDIGQAKGFLSKMCLITPDFPSNFKEAPAKFVVKICSQLPFSECKGAMGELEEKFVHDDFSKAIEENVRKSHNNEVTLYSMLHKYNVQNVYHMKKFSEENPLKGYIIMDYIAGNLLYHIFDNFEPQDLLQALRNVAALEAASLKFTEEDKSLFIKDIFSEMFAKVMDEEYGSEELRESVDKLEEVISEIIDANLADHLSELLSMQPVLCHGDLWSMNMIWKKGDRGPELAAFVDFQGAHFGCPTTDIVRLLTACLSAKDRRENWEMLLSTFYSYLQDEVGDGEMPYNMEQLKQAYRLYFPLGAFLIVPMIGPLFAMAGSSDDVEYKKRVQKVIFEKTKGLLDGILTFHEENKSMKIEPQN